ncbi:right-handed parallel beta-helix repeat-containing protein [Stieleria varia]|nr:right-handed parallel beta-helix repeat-containing protein [Stieleria varia]
MRHALIVFVAFAWNATGQAEINLTLPDASASALAETLDGLAGRRGKGELDRAVITLPDGTYRISKPLALSREIVGDGLTLKAESPGNVIFNGAVVLEGQSDSEANRWRYPLPESLDQQPRSILIDGRLSTAARFPEEGYPRIESALSDRRSGFIVGKSDLPDSWQLAEHACDVVLLHDWSSSRMPVASYDAASRTLRSLGPIGCAADHYAIDHFEKQPRYWLEGHPDFADEPGDWYVDRVNKQIVVVAADTLGDPPRIELPVVETLLQAEALEGTIDGLTLDGLVFTGTSFPMPPGGLAGGQATMHEARNADGSRNGPGRELLTAAVNLRDCRHCRVLRCEFRDLGATALWIGRRSQNCLVTHCTFQSIGGNAINVGEGRERRVDGEVWTESAPEQIATGNQITKCEISRCGVMLPGAVAIWAGLNKQLEIAENTIRDCPYTGVSLGWVWNDSVTPAEQNVVRDNDIRFVMQVLSDGAGVYTLGRQPDSRIENNVFTDVPLNAGRAESNGVFADEGTTGFTITGNTFRRIDRSPVRFHKAGKNIVSKNRWQLATEATPPVRFNNTPPENIEIVDNVELEREISILTIGNSLTWDTKPPSLDGNVHWHVDCGKSLQFIQLHPESPCVATSRLWPTAMATTQYDFVTVQPHYGTTVDEDYDVISDWVRQQPSAIFVIHTGWAKHEQFAEEWADDDPSGLLTHSNAHVDALLERLRAEFPEREFRCTQCTRLLASIAKDIDAGIAPIEKLSDLYRDAIHMKIESGRFLMHNAMRQALGQPLVTQWDGLDRSTQDYLSKKLAEPRQVSKD